MINDNDMIYYVIWYIMWYDTVLVWYGMVWCGMVWLGYDMLRLR